MERVCSEFFPHEAWTILGIPLSSWQSPGTLIWAGTKSGHYPTKSANKLLSEAPSSGPSNPSAHNSFQRNIWLLVVPNKIKYLIWRAHQELPPTKKNLLTRKVTRNSTCDLCKEEVKDVIHALKGYQALKEIWWEEPCLKNHLTDWFVDFRDLWTGIAGLNEHQLAERFAFVAWSIWHTRNTSRLQKPCLPFSSIYHNSLEWFQEFHKA